MIVYDSTLPQAIQFSPIIVPLPIWIPRENNSILSDPDIISNYCININRWSEYTSGFILYSNYKIEIIMLIHLMICSIHETQHQLQFEKICRYSIYHRLFIVMCGMTFKLWVRDISKLTNNDIIWICYRRFCLYYFIY